MDYILEINNLHKKYHNTSGEITAIEDVSLKVKDGEFIAIVGPSGCGKSTLLSIMCGLEDKSDGEIIIKDNKRLGYMLQEDCFFDWLNILDNCLIGLKIRKELTKEKKDKVISLLKTYGLGDFIYKPVNTYSSGMYSKLAFSITAILETDIMLIDEVLSVGDIHFKEKSYNKMKELILDDDRTVIIVSHSSKTLTSLCDRVIWLNDGVLKGDGPAEEIVNKYEEYMKNLD